MGLESEGGEVSDMVSVECEVKNVSGVVVYRQRYCDHMTVVKKRKTMMIK